MIKSLEDAAYAIRQTIGLVGACVHLRRENVRAASDGHDAVDGSQVSGEVAIVRSRTED